jgi:hypothetical protein
MSNWDVKPQIQTTNLDVKPQRQKFALCRSAGIEIDIDNIEQFKSKCSLRDECDSCHHYLTWQCDPNNAGILTQIKNKIDVETSYKPPIPIRKLNNK